MKKLKRTKFVSIFLLTVIGLNMLPKIVLGNPVGESEKKKGWKDFGVISLGDKEINLTSSDVTLIGDIHSNADFNSGDVKIAGKGSINSVSNIKANVADSISIKENAKKLEMKNIFTDIDKETSENRVVVDKTNLLIME